MDVSLEHFSACYLKAVSDILEYWTPEMQAETARHNIAWAEGKYDFSEYLYASKKRYEIFFQSVLAKNEIESVCDVGGFFGALPLSLARLGYNTTMTESLQYYSSSFDPLFGFLKNEGVAILDYDPFEIGAPSPGTFDVVSALAILEHYPHSPKSFMENVKGMSHKNTIVYIEVPNILYYPKRISMLMGKSPIETMDSIYRSESPFIGHHHEYSQKDLEILLNLSNMERINIHKYNYSFRGGVFMRIISDPALTFSSLFPNARESISVSAKFI